MNDIAIGAAAFLAAVAYWPGIDGASTSPRIAVIAGSMWLFLRPTLFTAGHAVVLLVIAWAAMTGLWTLYPWDWVWAMAELLILGMTFWAGSVQENLRPVYIGLALGLSISSAIAIGQYAGINPRWLAWQGDPAGLFVNKNIMAEIAALTAVGLIAERLWRYVPLVVPALVLPGCRGALVAFAVGVALVVPRIVAAGIFGLAMLAWALFARGGLDTVIGRMVYWSTALESARVFGNGAGSFMGLFPAAPDRPVSAHNDFLQAALDLGVPGALAYSSLAILVIRGDDEKSRAVLAAFLVEGLVGFPLHMPVTAMVFALVAGHLCSRWPELRVVAALRRAPV